MTRSNMLKNEDGIVLVIALIMLCMMTIIGTAVSNTTSVETIISGVEKEQREAFYVAEAGIDHAKGLLQGLYIPKNIWKISSGESPDWDFALDGTENGINAASDTNYTNGAQWITGAAMGENYTYSVRVWDNSDTGNNTPFNAGEYASDDGDGIIFIRSVATGPHGDSVAIEVSVEGVVSGVGTVTGYAAQAGAGSGKNYSSEDAEAITDFTQQL